MTFEQQQIIAAFVSGKLTHLQAEAWLDWIEREQRRTK